MLELAGKRFACCDGLPRRSFLKAGCLGLGGLALPDLLRLKAQAATSMPGRAVIFIEMAGGPTQFETYDPKPNAPVEIRGQLDAIATSVPGVAFSQHMVEQAKVMDKLAIIRSIRHDSNSHDPSSHLSQTGYYKPGPKGGSNASPCFGAVAARVVGANIAGMPPFVSIPRIMRNGAAAYLGKGYNPFETGGYPHQPNFKVRNLSLTGGLTSNRLADRQALLGSLDQVRRFVDQQGVSDSLDQFTRQAFDMVTGDRARKAFDIHAEDPRVRDRYGRTDVGQGMLLARRLIEAGVTCVTVRVGGWDDHTKIYPKLEKRCPPYDQGLATLVSDLADRGLDRDVLVVSIGEFGRTPRVNRNAGRDHWGALMSVLIAGGGLRMGQVIGASNSKGEVPAERPYRPENVLAMIYRHLGIDPSTTFNDFAGRPRYVLERQGLIEEFV